MKRVATLSEQTLQEQVVHLLRAYARPDIAWWHCPNGARLNSWKVKKDLKAMGVQPGASDLMFVIDERFHGVELKTEIGVVSDDQLTFKENVERAGGFYHAAFGLNQAIGVIQGISAFRPNIRMAGTLPASEGDALLPPVSASASRRLREPSVSSTHSGGRRVRKGSASGRASHSPNCLEKGGRR